MGNLLLHHPWVQFYLVFVAVLWLGFIWDYWWNPQPTGDGDRSASNEAAPRWAAPPGPGSQQVWTFTELGRHVADEVCTHQR